MLRTERRLITAGRYLEQDLKKSLRAQGHVVTRKTLNSIQVETISNVNGMYLNISMDTVGTFLDKGRAAGKYPNFDKILEWVQQRKLPRTLSGRASRSKNLTTLQKDSAFRIMKSIGKEGTPSKNSSKFSKTGKRTGFIEAAITKGRLAQLIDFDEVLIDFIGVKL